MVRHRRPTDPLRIMSYMAVKETEAFIQDHLDHPERITRIPVVRVGYGSFAPGLAEEFWGSVFAQND